jgi:methionine synthase II (cobalamin-independent)
MIESGKLPKDATERVWLTPDCGFATFADNPATSAAVAEATLRAIATAAEELRRGQATGPCG